MKRCPHLVRREEIDNRNGVLLSSRPCQADALDNGWCAWHKAGYETMEAGRLHGYRELQVNPSLFILATREQWMAYAEVATPQCVERIRAAIVHAHEKSAKEKRKIL
jgi:hypothetical protein